MTQGTDSAVMAGEGMTLVPAGTGPFDHLVRRIRSGEVEAFDQLMILVERPVLAVAWRILGDRDLARDAAQETFLRIFRSLDSFRLGEPFLPWVHRIAANASLDQARRRGPAPVALEDLGDLPQDTHGCAEALAVQDQQRELVRRALSTLTPAERSALVLRDLEGLDTEEVARALGVKAVTVRSQVSSARSKVQAFCRRMLTLGGPR